MSTRGVVAVGNLRLWRVVYNHSDSYPTWLGQQLYEHLTEALHNGKTLAEVGRNLLLFDDWRNYLNGGICEYCGKVTGQPHTISGTLMLGTRKHRGKYPDPQARYHQHNSLANVASEQFTEKDTAHSWLEWVYIIDEPTEAIHVLSLDARPHHVGDLRFDTAPNFKVLECGEGYERCKHYAWHHFPEIDQQGSLGQLGTRYYLGLQPMRNIEQACAFEKKGCRYQRLGSGMHGSYAQRFGIYAPDPNAWYEWVEDENGEKTHMAVARISKRGRFPYRGVTWVFPPTLGQPKETFRGGSH